MKAIEVKTFAWLVIAVAALNLAGYLVGWELP